MAAARNIIELAFYGEQSAARNILRAHTLKLATFASHIPCAFNELEFLEDGFNRFQIIVSIHIEHGVVFVVELAVRIDAAAIAFDEIFEIIPMTFRVAIWVHRHKARVLQKARIDLAARARKVRRHAIDHIAFKPIVAALCGQIVHRCG